MYSIIFLKKKSKSYRKIYIPSYEYNLFLKSLLPQLELIYLQNVIYECDHAFLKNRNCVTNARSHVKNRFVYNIDIENFFYSISSHLYEKYIPENLQKLILVDQQVVQGFPTSPYVANIAMIDVDFQITQALKKIDLNIVYTRYADDLYFSFNNKNYSTLISDSIKKVLSDNFFTINESKTSFQDKKNGRAIITGIGVSEDDIHPTRKTLKKLRAAKHQRNIYSYLGLLAWSKCIPPKKS